MDIVVRRIKAINKEKPHSRYSAVLDHFAPIWMGIVLLISDVISMAISGSVALFIWSSIHKDIEFPAYWGIAVFALIIVFCYKLVGLYPGVGLSPVEEIRLASLSTTGLFLTFGVISLYRSGFSEYLSLVGFAWIFLLVLVPTVRNAIRSLFSAAGVWGEPIAYIGYGDYGSRINKFLQNNPKYGYRSSIIIDGFSSKNTSSLQNIKYQKGWNLSSADIDLLKNIKTAFVITQDLPKEFLKEVMESRWRLFRNLIIISESEYFGNVWLKPQDLGGMVGMKLQYHLFGGIQQSFKRFTDLFIIILFSPLLLLVIIFLSVLILLDSRGPVLYRQKRIGKDGKDFMIWKFRTMSANAEKLLIGYFKKYPEFIAEWNDKKKLKNDPRITRVGKILRRLSLDELPQIYNIFCGDMSFVGPRPIVDEEIHYYGDNYNLYTRVKPGLTGLWQVSGRNDTTYDERVELDTYYVNNWSIWLDIYVLSLTIKAVITGKGAY